ncbi:MAG: hypothetical protein AAFX94_22310, partial [Myxococcota bacterium]
MLIPAILKVLEQELAENSRRATDTAEGATHEESRPENPKDTRGLEASYLAHGLAKRSAALEEDMRVLRNLPTQRFDKESLIASGAWVTLEDDGVITRTRVPETSTSTPPATGSSATWRTVPSSSSRVTQAPEAIRLSLS